MTSTLSCPNCAVTFDPHESGGLCPRCQTPLPTMMSPASGFESDETRLVDSESKRPTLVGSGPANAGEGPAKALEGPAKAGHYVRDVSSGTSTGWLSSSGAIDHGRFEPGRLLGGRYRIVERLGRGGMGEVYRADDLKLGQPVALKFLPADVDRDPARLTQLHTEVRMARQVSHPNVCRVYDIDEIDGATFLSMEYVDGEDLASLLRRIGRFPEDRALAIARQICAGLAAAHERGVVHRDLKPANVMLDGTGKVRITDFGLAGASGEALRAGTPAYMAPEQLAGSEVTPRSDIYSLGLVLYEVFTGQRALDGKNLAELIHKREQVGIAPPTSIVKSLDPDIDVAVMRCLRPEPEARPKSAVAVAAALPGGDPLAAALAAGETPSPEMVAAAGSTDELHPGVAFGVFAAIIAALIACAAIGDRVLLVAHAPMQKTLDALEDRARDINASLGYGEPATDSARGLFFNGNYLKYIETTDRSPNRWQALDRRDAPTILFWQRRSPSRMLPLAPEWSPTRDDPPPTQPGMTTTVLDDAGRLREFVSVLAPSEAVSTETPAPPWPALFRAAGLTFEQFTPVASEWIPRSYADTRAAWEGPLRDGSNIRIRVEAASYRGRAVSFKLIGPWTPKEQPPEDASTPAMSSVIALLNCSLLFGSLALARANLRAGRGDRRGAARAAGFTVLVWLVAWTLAARHFLSLPIERNRLFDFIAYVLFNAGVLWILYLALEPYVRRFTPEILISWTRVLSGQLRDARVGRDILAGVAVGVAMATIGLAFNFVPGWLGRPPSRPQATSLAYLMETRIAVGALLRVIPNAVGNAMAIAVLFVVGRAVTRSTWGGTIVAVLVLAVFVFTEALDESGVALALLFSLIFSVPLVGVLVRFGLFAETVAFFVNQALSNAPLTIDFTRPYASGALIPILFVVGLAAFGFYAVKGSRPLFGHLLQTDP